MILNIPYYPIWLQLAYYKKVPTYNTIWNFNTNTFKQQQWPNFLEKMVT